jgi:hypothetical protein
VHIHAQCVVEQSQVSQMSVQPSELYFLAQPLRTSLRMPRGTEAVRASLWFAEGVRRAGAWQGSAGAGQGRAGAEQGRARQVSPGQNRAGAGQGRADV